MVWDKRAILRKLRQLHRSGAPLSYNAMTKSMQPLLSASAYHFGSYHSAVEKAGIDYTQITRRPRWTKQAIIRIIKKARRDSQDLHWSAVTKRNDELSRAAFAALQPRLFARWDRALHAAGLDADDISQYRKWDRSSIVFELRQLHQAGEPLNSGALQKDDPGLHAAALRHFKTYDSALRAARIDPKKTRLKKRH
ncbi:MAG TPA: hypothetical protein VGG19_01680 [Tepidisphaeraceae bacterium]|jgi:hypothetical protein